MGEGRKLYNVLVGKPEGKRPLGRPRRRWVYGIKMDLRETGWTDVEWIHLSQDRNRLRAVMNTVIDLRFLAPQAYLVKSAWREKIEGRYRSCISVT
jgi:hypothetical protein